jgi:hypothetical protein
VPSSQAFDWERVEARPLAWFYRLLGMALLAQVLTDLRANLWAVHTGELFAWQHVPGVPLYSTGCLVLEWLALACAGLGLVTAVQRRWAVRLGLAAVLVGLSQRYANHRALLAIALLFAALRHLDPADAAQLRERHPNVALLRQQLVLVYAFSALNKLVHGFTDGHVLTLVLGLSPALARPAAWLVVAAELAAPICLWRAPVPGLLLVALLHIGFAAWMPALWPFSITMIALAVLFMRERPAASQHRDERRALRGVARPQLDAAAAR